MHNRPRNDLTSTSSTTNTSTSIPPSAPPRPAVDFAAAIGFLTLLPIGRTWPDERRPRSVGWYGWVGWVLGAIVLAPVWLTVRTAGLPDATHALLLGAVAVAAWALLTRFLHWDGLADTFDGIWGGDTVERKLEIMRDSRIGSFGAAAMVMTALLQVIALGAVLAHGMLWPLIAAPVAGRLAASLAAWQLPAARREGLGLTAMEKPERYEWIVSGSAALVLALLLAVAIANPLRVLLVLCVAAAAAFLVPRMLARPVGGMTGDLFGATVILVETVVLLIGAVI
jgi:adenosylcobinamide-GDP ribazoletransferase